MKNQSFIFLCMLFLAACQPSDEIVTPSDSYKIEPRSHQQSRPFKGNLSGALNPNSAPTPCTGDLPLALLDYSISGKVTHLGKLNANNSSLHHENCDLSLATMLLTTDVSGQLAAANGDLVYYTGEDVINVFNLLTGSGPTGPITGTWTIIGGTGRFEGASGSFTINGLVTFATLSFNAVAEGTITY